MLVVLPPVKAVSDEDTATMLRELDEFRALVEKGEVTELVIGAALRDKTVNIAITVTSSRLVALGVISILEHEARNAPTVEL